MHEPRASALLALWNDVEPEVDALYNDWHANEHVPERLTVPGMLWARRYATRPGTPGPRYLTFYGLRSADVLASAPYLRLLAHPTPLSARMRPHLHNISRWVCELRALRGAFDAHLLFAFACQTEADARRSFALAPAEASAGSLLAERIPDAAPLPWMKGSQARGIAGDWLAACAADTDPHAAQAGRLAYEQRPVNGGYNGPRRI